jgi:hypothetical protein
LQTHIATTESVSLCVPRKADYAVAELESAVPQRSNQARRIPCNIKRKGTYDLDLQAQLTHDDLDSEMDETIS